MWLDSGSWFRVNCAVDEGLKACLWAGQHSLHLLVLNNNNNNRRLVTLASACLLEMCVCVYVCVCVWCMLCAC